MVKTTLSIFLISAILNMISSVWFKKTKLNTVSHHVSSIFRASTLMIFLPCFIILLVMIFFGVR